MYNLNKEKQITGYIKDNNNKQQYKICTMVTNNGSVSLFESVLFLVIIFLVLWR